MQLRELTLITPTIEAGQVFKAIDSAIPIKVIAFSFWSKAAMRDVLKNLVDGLSEQWTRLSQYWKVPNSASISEA